MADVTRQPLVQAGDPAFRIRAGEPFEDAHWVAAMVAAIISLSIHALFVWGATRVDFGNMGQPAASGTTQKWPESMQVESVDLSGTSDEILEALQTFNGTAMQDGVADKLHALQLPLEEASVEPPATEIRETEVDIASLQATEPPPLEDMWQPRQQILAIETKAVAGEPPDASPRQIPAMARVPNAPDIVLPVDTASMTQAPAEVLMAGLGAPGPGSLGGHTLPDPAPSSLLAGPTDTTPQAEGQETLFEEEPEEVTDVENIEQVLAPQIETFVPGDGPYGYFRVQVERAGETLLPVLPKDVLLVQDTSSTIAERRLRFSRRAMLEGLELLGPDDRFNVATFVGRTSFCFPGWARNNAQNRAKARAFIEAMEAEGNTDFLRSMRDLLTLQADPGRPVIAMVITDGIMHSGVTDSSEVIGAFTQANAGRFAIYTVGVADYANAYLLDMLSYSNMGSSHYVHAGRWDIPETILAVLGSVRRPVLTGLRFRFPTDSGVEGFPIQPGNLYLDRPLTLYGRFPIEQQSLTFQAIGRAGTQQSDMVYSLPLGPDTRSKDDSIRDAWSLRKIYHLIGVYTTRQDRDALREMRQISREYDQPIPYRRTFGF